MKIKLRASLMLVFMMLLMPMLTGCPNPKGSVVFKDYDLTNFDELNSTAFLSFDFGISKSYEKYYFNVTGPVNYLGISKGSSPNTKDIIYNDACIPVNTSEGALSSINISDFYAYSLRAEFSKAAKTKIGLKKPFTYQVNIYKDKNCKKLHETYSTKEFVFTDKIKPNPVNEVINAIGGKRQYCNIDSSSNYKTLDVENLFVRIAYSQIGYKEKETNGGLELCTENRGTKNFQKYGNNGQAWSSHFVQWVLQRANVKQTLPVNLNELVKWAQSRSRWMSPQGEFQNGDLLILKTGSGTSGLTVGILYKENGTNNVILGNWNNAVVSVPLLKVKGSATPYGIINLKGIVY